MSEPPNTYKQILDSGRDGITINSDRIILYVNESFAQMVDYKVEELIGMDILHVTASEYRENVAEKTKRRQAGDQVGAQYEVELVRKDGTRFPVEYSVSRIDYEGKSSSLTIIRDITERKKVEDEFENLFNLSPDMQCICTPEGEFISVNLACEKILGYTTDEIVKLGWANLVHPDDMNSTSNEVDEQLEGGSVSNFINRFRCKDGSYKTLEWQASPVINGIVYATARDITDQKKRVDELRYHAMLLQNLSDGVISTSMDSIIMGWNKASETLYGYTETEAIGKSVAELLRNEYVGVSRSAVLEAFSLYGFWEGEVIQKRKNGDKVYVDAKVSVFNNDEGEPVGIVAVNRDITEQKLAEDALRSSEDLFRGFMQSATDAFLILDKDMHYLNANDSWLQQSGLKREDVIGKHMLELFPGLKKNGRYNAYLKVLETGEPVEFRAVESVFSSETLFDISGFSTGDVLGIISRDVSDQVKYRRRLEALHSHALSLAGTFEINEIIAITCECLIETLGFKRGSLGLVEGDHLVFNNNWGYEKNDPLTIPLDGLGFTVKAVNTRESILVNNANQSEVYVNQPSEYSAQSELDVPVILDGEAFAVINIESERNYAFSFDDQRLVETLASHVASAFAKIKYNERLSALHSFAFELDIVDSVEDVAETTFRIMKQLLGFQFSSFQLLEDEGLVSVGTSDRSNLGHVMPLTGKGITVRAAREAHTMLVGDVRDDPDFQSWSTDSRSELAVPIMGEDRVLGVLNVESLELNAFSEDDARLLEVLAQNVASALFRIRAVEELRESEDLFRGFMESAIDEHILLDENLYHIYVNQSMLNRLDLTNEEVIGKHVLEMAPGIKTSGRYDAYLNVIETGIPIVLREVESNTTRGMIHDIHAFKASTGLGIIMRDVSDRIKYQRRLETLHGHAAALASADTMDDVAKVTENFLDHIIGSDLGGMSFVEGDQLVTKYIWKSDPLTAAIEKPLNGTGLTVEAVNTGKTLNIRDVREHPLFMEGVNDWVILSELVVPILVDGKAVGAINMESEKLNAFNENDQRLVETLAEHISSVFLRIRADAEKLELGRQILSEQLRVEQEQELGRMKDQFIITATHELRTPVTSILGYIELILEDPGREISDSARKDLNVVLRNANRLVSFVNDLLDVQRITSGRFEAPLAPVDIVKTLDEVVGEMSHLFSEKDQVLVVEAPEIVVVSANETRFSQLMINMLRNANKFTPEEGQVTVTVEPSEDHVRVSVKDTGVGLSEEDISKLFVPFPGISPDLGVTSTGLGLAICKGIVDLHGGEIWVESDGHGKGSTFHVKLPIKH